MKINSITIFSLQLLPAIATAAAVKNLVVFGDSNSDVGNSQRWSDGPLWSEYLAAGWNATLHSFAYSGSVCDSSMYNSITAENRVPSLKDQLDNYYNLKLNFDPAETVYAFWFGTQDIFEMAKRHGKHEPDYKEITDCIGQQLRVARKAFLSDRFLVLNVPPLEHMPYYQNTEVAANRSQAAIEINKGLEKDVANLNKHHHALEMDYVDIHSLINHIVIDPGIFNFKKPVESFLDECSDEKCKNNGKHYVWWDRTHLTTAFHKLIAKSILEAESYMPKATLTNAIEKQLNDLKSKYHSPKYVVGTSHTGAVEEAARLYDIEKAKPTQPHQPPLEEEDEIQSANDLSSSNTTSPQTFFGLFVFFAIIGIIIAWIKYPNAVIFNCIRGNRDRGKFIPVRNEEA